MTYHKEHTKGAIMLEALIVYGITIFLLFLVLALFSVFYHLWNVQAIANEAATRVAQTYKYIGADVDTGYVEISQISELKEYRYLLGGKHELEEAAADRLEGYINDRLDHTSFVNRLTDTGIQVEVKKDAMGSRHIKVTVQEEFSVPFGEVLTYFGYDSTISYEDTAYARCLDLVDYINMEDFASYQISLEMLDDKVVKLINAVLGLFDQVKDMILGTAG